MNDQLPLRVRRFREAAIKDATLKLCPCCRTADETPIHFLSCSQNPVFESSFATPRSEIINKDSHPVRYLLVDGLLHFIQSTDLFNPAIEQYPSHFASAIQSALSTQNSIGWINAFKGYFAESWAAMAQMDMHSGTAIDTKLGELRMKSIIRAVGNHTRRLWMARKADQKLASIRSSEEFAEIEYYHSRPHLLRTGDQHYCQRPLSQLLSSAPATRRQWLRKVKRSTAELTKDGTRQSLITNFFRLP